MRTNQPMHSFVARKREILFGIKAVLVALAIFYLAWCNHFQGMSALHYLDILVLTDTPVSLFVFRLISHSENSIYYLAVINPAIPPLVSSGSGLIGSIINAVTSRRNVKRTIQANKELAEYQYSKDLEMWNKGNLYNSPEQQMQRLKAAGLNPNLVYGSGSVAGNTAANLPHYNAPTVQYNYEPFQVPDMLGRYQDMVMKQAQIDNTIDMNENIRTEKKLKDERIKDFVEFRYGKKWALDFKNVLSEYDLFEKGVGLKKEGDYLDYGGSTMPERMRGYQGDYKKERLRALEKQVDSEVARKKKMETETEYMQKQSQWYLWKLFGGMGTDIMKALPGMMKAFSPAGRARDVMPQRNKVGRISDDWLRKHGYKD